MVRKDQQSAEKIEQRQGAEAMALKIPEPSSKEYEALSPDAMRRLIHDLQVHQIELEMQNEELRRAQLALSVSTACYLNLYDFSPVGYCTVNEQGLIRRANLTVATFLGRDRSLLIEQPLRSFILDTDQDIFYLHLQQLLATGEDTSCELRLVKPDGTTAWTHLTLTTEVDADEKPAHRIVLTDISERKQRDDTIRLQALVLDQIQDQVTITDLNGIVTYVNQSNRDHHGPQAPDMTGRHVSDFGEGPQADATQHEIVEATLRNGAWRGKVVNSLPDGSYMLADLRTLLIRDNHGEPIAMVGVGSDITERHKLEQALLQSEILSTDILNSLDAEIAVLDRDGAIRAINEPWRRFASEYGFDPGKVTPAMGVGTNYLAACAASSALSHAPLYIHRNIRAVLDRTVPGFSVTYPCHLANQEHWFQMRVMPLSPLTGSGVVIEHSDISEQKQSEAALIAALVETKNANNSKSRFLAAASHDLRQPLSALSLYVGVLERRASPDNAELVGSINDCVARLSELLTDLLDVSKLEAGVLTPKPSAFSIDEVLTDLASIHSSEAELKGLRLRFRNCGATGRTDQVLFCRLLSNLIANAITYTNSGGVLIACRHHQGKFWVEVWDTGVGIAEDQFEAIFDEFRQLGDGARTRGSGLGLAIVDKTAKLLGLKLRLRSRPGRGSMFAVELPKGRALDIVGAAPTSLSVRGMRVALVDDNVNLRTALILALQGAGHDVIGAASGRELLGQLGQQAPDIVISDYRLAANENGFDVIRAVRDCFGQDLPAFLITGDTDPALIRSMAERDIAVHYKPFEIDALQAFIGRATERRSL